ncbi:MAG TPA: site-2 protease family protein [Candidatus Polarisedimenticolaceae bacterium]|nr:site-2 protease family protein [Candidatus Polarisedimenticolaceae bacterium]
MVFPPRSRAWLHLLLFAATAWSLALSAWITWAGGFEEIAGKESVRAMGGALLAAAVRWDVLRAGAPYALTVLAILGAHEMGHYLACRRYRIPATLPFFIPGIVPFGTFGAVIRVRGVVPHRKALFDVAAAGPLAGFVIGLVALVAGSMAAEGAPSPLGRSLLVRLLELSLPPGRTLSFDGVGIAGWFGMLVTSLNLFPVGQLDGGHAAYAVSRGLHRALSRWTVIAMIAFVGLETLRSSGPSPYVLWTVVLILMRDRHPRLADETGRVGIVRLVLFTTLAVVFLLTFLPAPF